MVSVGSSHSALTSGEDNEEASLLGCPPIGLLDEEEFSSMPPRDQARDRALYHRPKTPKLYGPLGNRNANASRRNYRRREQAHASPHSFSYFHVSLPFRFHAARAGAVATGEERPAEPGAKRAGHGGLLHDGGIVVCGGGGEDSADRDGLIAHGGESAASDG